MKKDIYSSSRICYIIEATAEYLISLLITGTYLAKLTTTLGFSDSLTAILSSFVALGCSFQLFTLVFFRSGRVKRRVVILHTINQLLFMMLYVIPFFRITPALRTFLFILFLFGGYMVSNITHTTKINWFMSLVSDGQRGIFTSIKEAISLICGILFQLSMGSLIDYFEASGNIRAAFIVCGITIFGLTLIHTLSMIFAKEKEPIHKKATPLKQSIMDIVSDKKVSQVVLITVFWSICTHISISFFGTYQVKELGFSMTFIAFLSFLYAAARIPASFFLGRYADKYSFANMLKICFGITTAAFIIIIFTVPSNGHIMYTLYYILYAAAMGGINSAQINLVYDVVPPEKRNNTLAIQQSVSGIIGFLATLAVTPLVDYIQENGLIIWGQTVYVQQLLSAVSAVISILLIVYISKTVTGVKAPNK